MLSPMIWVATIKTRLSRWLVGRWLLRAHRVMMLWPWLLMRVRRAASMIAFGLHACYGPTDE